MKNLMWVLAVLDKGGRPLNLIGPFDTEEEAQFYAEDEANSEYFDAWAQQVRRESRDHRAHIEISAWPLNSRNLSEVRK